MKRRVHIGEYFAIDPGVIERDADGFFIVIGESVPANETRGTVGVVHIRGALSQFKGEAGDSYEAIVERVCAALDAEQKPSCVALCISSPGGVVAGLNEAVFKLQRLSVERKIPLVAIVNELAASAAFALACACTKRLAPPSAIIGSIGTISTMVSQKRADEAAGLDYRIITSGKRKADGHPHAAITDDAVRAEKARNSELAEQFFDLAARALKMAPTRIEALEAAIFVGANARRAGLVDKIMSVDGALAGLDRSESKPKSVAPNEGNVTDRRAKELDNVPATGSLSPQAGVTNNVTHGEAPMPKIQNLIAKTEAAIATETDPAQLRILQAKLGTFLARAEMDDDKGDDDDDDDDKAKKAEEKARKAKRAEEKAKLKSKRADEDAKYAKRKQELDDEERKLDEDDAERGRSEEDEARTAAVGVTSEALALIERNTGMSGAAAMGAAQALFSLAKETSARVATIEKTQAAERRAALIKEARPLCAASELKWLESQPLASVEGFVEMRRKAGGIIHTDEGTLIRPRAEAPGTYEALPEDIRSLIEDACKHAGVDDRESLRKALVETHTKQLAHAGVNGAGRY